MDMKFFLSLSLDPIRPRDYTAMWLCGLKLIKLSHHLATFCGHKHCSSGDTMLLVCHMISQNHIILWLFDFMGKM